jgi:uncharacterized protein HemX
MSDQPTSSPDDDAPENPEVRHMEEAAMATRSQPSGRTAKVGSWIILAVLGLCLIVALVVIVSRMRR